MGEGARRRFLFKGKEYCTGDADLSSLDPNHFEGKGRQCIILFNEQKTVCEVEIAPNYASRVYNLFFDVNGALILFPESNSDGGKPTAYRLVPIEP